MQLRWDVTLKNRKFLDRKSRHTLKRTYHSLPGFFIYCSFIIIVIIKDLTLMTTFLSSGFTCLVCMSITRLTRYLLKKWTGICLVQFMLYSLYYLLSLLLSKFTFVIATTTSQNIYFRFEFYIHLVIASLSKASIALSKKN